MPLGEYTVTVTIANFQPAVQSVFVTSGSSPVLHFPMELAGVSEKTVVTGEPVSATLDSVTPTTLLNRQDIQDTPGADRTNSLAMITDYVPGAYFYSRSTSCPRRAPGKLAGRRRAGTQHEHRK